MAYPKGNNLAKAHQLQAVHHEKMAAHHKKMAGKMEKIVELKETHSPKKRGRPAKQPE
jgi:hypothetical protein